MRNRFRSGRLAALTVGAAAALAALPRSAAAQSAGPDVSVVSPNVMLLVDTSGSMELKSGGGLPACVPGTPNTGAPTDQNEKSRWVNLVEVLSGTIEGYSCYAESKSSPEFKTEYALGPSLLLPRDYNDSDAYHRPLSNGCAPGPGDLPTTKPWDWPAPPLEAIKYRPYVGSVISPTTTCPAGTWSQAGDGLLSSFNGLLRFGLMTFDTEADPGTGVASPNLTYGLIDGAEDDRNGIRGAWSYYLTTGAGCRQNSPVSSATDCHSAYPDGTGQANQAGCCMGGPINCTTLSPLEVGARNAAAPPWEGRMVAFGPPSEDGTKRNAWIQEILRASRPFGATPIAGMLNDARDFFWNDDTKDPLSKATGDYFGPSKDPQVENSCRDNYIVLLTDGEPNMDLRTPCEGAGSDKCPYDRSEDIVKDLANPSGARKPVRTFVVGFALDQVDVGGVPTDCRTLDPASPACLNPTDQALRTCCTMNNIAFNGTPVPLQSDPSPTAIKYALFPQNAQDLRTALSTLFSTAGAKQATRTYPVTVPAALSDKTVIGGAKPVGYEFTSGGDLRAGWKALLGRQRINCDGTQVPTAAPLDATKGDDFIKNVNNAPESRLMFTVEATGNAAGWDPTYSIRPYFTDVTLDDGVHFEDGAQSDFVNPQDLKDKVSVQALKGVTAGMCGTPTATACKDRIVTYMAGVRSASPVTRCKNAGSCNVVGDIFHSVPQVISGIPSEFLRDPTYTQFAREGMTRDAMLYTSSNDGFFHGFWLTPGDGDLARVVDSVNILNESWAFIPPAVLPFFNTMYPSAVATATPNGTVQVAVNRIPALDGVPVIRDVAATKGGLRALNTNTTSSQYYPFRLERKKFPAADESHTWRSVMAQAFGPKQGGYFALDVTSPFVPRTTPNADKTIGPKFLWQLTKDTSGKQMFGSGGPTPLITTLFVNLSNLGLASASEQTLEVPVAVLPGGKGGSPSPANASCGSAGPFTDSDIAATSRSTIRCYEGDNDSYAARSLTIVRLDNGQVLRTFRPTLTAPVTQPVTFDPKVLTLVDIQAPIVGQPAAFPSQAGQIADRIFVGDAEGRIWRIDVSKPKPEDWTMTVFFDAYYDLSDPIAVPPEPVQTPPVLSVDGAGQLTVAFSTGDQDNLTPDALHKNYIVSVTETVVTPPSGNREFHAKMNWRLEIPQGAKVLGPMSLLDRNLYYSIFGQAVGSKACEGGDSNIWAVDYINPSTSSPTTGGGLPAPATATGAWPILYKNAVVSGVALRQMPACTASTASTNSSDDFLGYGKTTTVSTVNPGAFQLVVQTSGAPSGGSTPGKVPTAATDIAPPRIPVRVDSWAPIIE